MVTVVGKMDPTGGDRKRESDRGKALAGKSTLNRMELGKPDTQETDRYKKIVVDVEKVSKYFVDVFLQAHNEAPKEIILDIDATDDPLHGNQEGRFFHGYYGGYCYMPLYIFCGDFLLCARLRTADSEPAKGAVEEIKRIVEVIRQKWPGQRIMVRGDSGFCRDEIMTWCEGNGVNYLVGLARNARLEKILSEDMARAKSEYEETGKAARVFRDFEYETLDSWSGMRRVIGKAEYLEKGANPRFVVTNLSREEYDARELYEDIYCARGEMENRIKEQQLEMFADRTSTSLLRSNQLRLWFSSVAYVLMNELRRLGLSETDLEQAQCGTIRLKLIKIGAQVRVSSRRIYVAMATGNPFQEIFLTVFRRLMALEPLIC
jgi:hypothetical protein